MDGRRNMFAALLGGDPGQHWEHTIIYTKHTTITPRITPGDRPHVLGQSSPFTPVYRGHRRPFRHLLVCSDTFMCHWIPP